MKPYDPLPCEVEYKGQIYALNLAYSVFFAVADVLYDERLTDAQKVKALVDSVNL